MLAYALWILIVAVPAYFVGKALQSIWTPRRIYPNGTATYRDDATLANRAARKRRQRRRRALREAGVSEDEVWRQVPHD